MKNVGLLHRFAARKTLLVFLVAYAVYFPIFFFADVPFGLKRIQPYAAGTGILDVEFFYTADAAYRRLALFGEPGRAVYRAILMGDLVYPALLGGLLSVSLSLLVRRLGLADTHWRYLAALPLANMTCDYVEDGLILGMLHVYPAEMLSVATAAGMFTCAKNVFGLVSFVALGLGLLALGVQHCRHRLAPSVHQPPQPGRQRQ